MLKRYYKKGQLEAGCDEAGRGCLAGPVTAAAVILPIGFSNKVLNDSKKLTKKQRDQLRIIIENEALAWSVAFVSPAKIDEINILNASILAMQQAVDQLKLEPNFLLIDGNRFKEHRGIPHLCVIRGDGIYMSIAAASVLAKTHRDDYMMDANLKYPGYSWDSNKGYPTKPHRARIIAVGPTEIHRMTFRLYPEIKQGQKDVKKASKTVKTRKKKDL